MFINNLNKYIWKDEIMKQKIEIKKIWQANTLKKKRSKKMAKNKKMEKGKIIRDGRLTHVHFIYLFILFFFKKKG